MPLTRTQVLDHIETAFGNGPITSTQLRQAAADHGADTDVLVLLGALPERQFRGPRDLWPYLPDLPVGG
ncbi:hypothetical protein A7K94_0212060 [Modestobacter sp. VKM Ac-2676]|nr:hypothetical protein A7K94_0212060 [Modestobacter sp. VKM Ac-2676]